MLPIQAVLYVVPDVDLVDDLVRILLQSRCEDDYFVVASHSLDELDTARSHKEKAIVLVLHKNIISIRASKKFSRLTSTLWMSVSSRSSTNV